MAQHDYNLANQSGADFRADLNNALSAIATVNSGATAPSTTFAHQLWVDTSSSVLKIRNAANDAWVTTGVSITADNTFTGNITGNAATATALETARTINGASFDGTANISFDTDSVSEGSSNLYFTNARVESYLDAGTSTPTFASAVINTSITGSAILDDDSFGTASATTVATSESIKAYVDSQIGSVDTLAEILLNGNTTGGTDIAFGDNDKAIFGTGSDLSIFHDGSHSYISENGTGNLILKGGGQILLKSPADENMIVATGNGAVGLYYDNVAKFATTSTGIDVTGRVTANGLTSEGSSGTWEIQDNGYIQTFSRAGANYIRASDASGILRFDTGGTTIRQKIAANGDISFYDDTGSTQGFFWDSSAESLGIGTTSPNAKLTVQNGIQRINSTDGSSDARIQFSMTDGSDIPTAWAGIPSWNKDAFYIFAPTATGNESAAFYTNANWVFQTGGTEALRIDSSQRVGIGTSSPNYELTVGGSDAINSIQLLSSTTGTGATNGLRFWNTGSSVAMWNYDNTPTLFGTNNTERARFDTSGNLLVGTTSSANTTDGVRITSGGYITIAQDAASVPTLYLNKITNDGQYINFQKDGTEIGSIGVTNSDNLFIGGTNHSGLQFGTSIIYPTGGTGLANTATVDIGHSSYKFKDLHLSGTAYTGGYIRGSSSDANKLILKASSSTTELHAAGGTGLIFKGNGDNERARIDSSGNLLVGTTSSTPSTGGNSITGGSTGYIVTSHADGTASGNWYHAFRYNTNTIGSITQSGTTAVLYNTSSDARLKDVTGEARGLEVITKLNPVAYNWKADGKADEGLIAQEVKELVPNAVTGSEDEHYQMDYSKLVTHLVKGMKEQQEQIESLKSEIANLKGE